MSRLTKTPRLFLIAASFLLACGPPKANETIQVAEILATVSQRIHPVLIRNDHNSLIQVLVEVQRSDVHVTSATFSLQGTDDPNDLESLQLFYSGSKGLKELDPIRSGTFWSGVQSSYSSSHRSPGDRHTLLVEFTGRPFGRLSKPAAQVTFYGDQMLQPGTNVFWLSGKLRSGANLSHKVDAHCIEITTSVGSVSPLDTTPGVRKRIGMALRKGHDDGVHTSRIPALTTTTKGTLLCVYDVRQRKRRDLQEDIDIGLSRSTDGGQTWEPLRIIMDMGEYGELPNEQNGISDPGIVVDQNSGDIFCAAVWMWGKPGKHQWVGDGSEPGYKIGESAQFLMVQSKDDGLTWTSPKNMTRGLKKAEWILLAPSPQAGITLRDGTLVMPGEGRDAEDHQFSTLIVSRDHGATWTVGSPALNASECQAVQLDDGSILLNARTEASGAAGGPGYQDRVTKFRSVWVTEDLGKTWKPHETHRKSLIEPNCNGSLLRFDYQENGKPEHILIFANPHSQTNRVHQSIQISFDEGRTWPEKYRILLDEGRGSGYPTMTRIDDSHIGIVYEGSQAHLVFEKLSLDELLRRGE